MANKFKLMWENNPSTPIDAPALSAVVSSSSEYGGILYKDIPELLPNGLYSDGFLKIRSNSKILMKSYKTRALLFNFSGSLVSHNSQFGPIVQDNIAFQTKDGSSYVYAGKGTTNLLSNPGFEQPLSTDFDWWTNLQDEDQPDGYVDPVWGEEYKAKIETVSPGYESDKCLRMFTGAFGRTELSRSVDLSGKSTVSLSFYYKTNGSLKFYITSGGLYWKNGDWNPSTSSFYDLESTNGEWKRIEVKNIILQKIQNTDDDVGIYVYADTPGIEAFVDSFQLEEHNFSSPYIDGTRADAILKYPANIIDLDKGLLDVTFMPKASEDFAIISVPTDLPENALDLMYVSAFDQYQFRIYDTQLQSYISISIAARMADRIDDKVRIICSWDKSTGIKIINTSSPNIESNNTAFTPYSIEHATSFDVASNRGSDKANIFIDVLKINANVKDDVEILKDFQSAIQMDEDVHKVYSIGEEAQVIDESMLDVGTYSPNTTYYVWVVDNMNETDADIVISTSSHNPKGVNDCYASIVGGFKTDANNNVVMSSIWDVTTKEDKRVHTERLLVHGVDSDSYLFDIRTTPFAETNDVRSTIPINFSNNLYGRHSQDIYNSLVQYFEVNNAGWVGIDNILVDGNKITTRDYADNNGVKNNNLELTVSGVDTAPKVWIHAHEIDIDSGNRDIQLDDVRIDDNIIYTKPSADLYIDVTHTDGTTTKNNIIIKGQDLTTTVNRNALTTVYGSNTVNVTGNYTNTVSTGNFTVSTTGGFISLDNLKINTNNLYNDAGDMNVYATGTVNIDSGASGIISLDDILIKDNLIYRSSGDIKVETPGNIYLGKSGAGTNPDLTSVVIRSDMFKVESQSVEFTNVDALDFIRFDNLKIRQSEMYTELSNPISVNSSGSLTLHSSANVYLNTSSNVEIQETGGSFYSRVASTFTKDLTVYDIIFSNVDSSDSAKIFTDNTSGTTKLRFQVSDDAADKLILEHKSTAYPSGNSMLQVGQSDVTVEQDLIVKGNLTVQGDSTTLNTATLTVEDNVVTLNSNVTGIPSLDAGIEVRRGTSANANLQWSEANDLWRLTNGDGIWHNVIFNGYDERFSENVNIVTTEPAGFKLENDHAVAGMELVNPTSVSTSIGEAVMNIGLHMGQSGGYINDKLVGGSYSAASVGAWMAIDTRASQKKFKWMWEDANSNSEFSPAMLTSTGDFSTGNIELWGNNTRDNSGTISFRSNPGGGTGDAAYIKYYATGTTGEATRLELGVSNETDDVVYISGSTEINGNLKVNGSLSTEDEVTINGSGSLYTGAQNSTSGTTYLNYDGYLRANRVINAVYNDLAEYFVSNEKPVAGSVYVIDNGKVRLSNKRADKAVIGVCSDSAAYVMKEEYKDKGILIALSGSVKVWTRSHIKSGVELVSDKEGFAVKANIFERLFKRSAIIGKAIENNEGVVKRILILVK